MTDASAALRSPTDASAPPRSPFDRLRARGLIVQCLLAFAAVMAAFGIAWPGGSATTSRSLRVVGLLIYLTGALVLLVRARRARLDWQRLFGERRIPRESLPLLTGIIPVVMITVGAAIAVFIPLSYIAPGFVERTILDAGALFEARTIPEWLEVVVLTVFVAPIVEELFFRGFLLHRWARRWGTPTGVVASSALFAVLHGEWIGHFLFGVVMAALYLRTRRLWMPIVAHAINNGLVALLGLVDLLQRTPATSTSLAELRSQWPLGLVALIAGVLMLRWYLTRFWPGGQWRTVLRGPTPYDHPDHALSESAPRGTTSFDGPDYAASASGSPDATSAS